MKKFLKKIFHFILNLFSSEKEPNQTPSKSTNHTSSNRPLIAATRKESTYSLNVLEGEIPRDWFGHIYITSPAGNVNSNGLPYPEGSPDQGSPIMNGDGFTYKIDLSPSEVVVTTKLMKTPCFYADLATKEGNENGYGPLHQFRNMGISRLSPDLGARDELNTAITPFKFGREENTPTRMLACYDAGRPWEIDIESLELITAIGKNSEYSATTPDFLFPFPVVQTTAHPSFDPYTQEVFSVNFTKSMSTEFDQESIVKILKGDTKKVGAFLEKVIERLEKFDDPNSKLAHVEKLIENEKDELFGHGLHLLKGTLHIHLKKPKSEQADASIEDNVYLMRWTGEQKPLEKWQLKDENNENIKIIQCIHQTTITEDYVLIADAAFKFSMDLMFNSPFKSEKIDTWLRKHLTVAQEPFLDVYLIKRADLDSSSPTAVCRKLSEPIDIEAIHFTADYKNPNNEITLHLAHNSAACLAEWVRDYDVLAPFGDTEVDPAVIGLMSAGCMDIGRIGKVLIDAENATIKDQHFLTVEGDLNNPEKIGAHTWGVGLYTFRDIISADTTPDAIRQNYYSNYGLDPRLLTKFIFDLYGDYPKRKYKPAQMLKITKEGIPFVLVRHNVETMQLEDVYQFDKNVILKSIQFVPRVSDSTPVVKDDQKDGYIFTTELVNYPNAKGDNYQCEIWIFKAWDLAAGPLCKFNHPELDYAFTLHSAWTKDAVSQEKISYYIDPETDYNEVIDNLEPDFRKKEIQSLFDKFVYPNFKL